MSVTKGAFRTFFAHVSPLRLQQFIGLGWSLQGISCTFYLGLKKVFPSPLHGFWIKTNSKRSIVSRPTKLSLILNFIYIYI